MIFHDVEKEYFAGLMRKHAAFAGIRILAYCLMGNHFHLLLEVPRRPDAPPSVDEVFARLAHIYSEGQVRDIRRKFELLSESERPSFLERYWRRMLDLSQYLKDIKQRFSAWHNKRQERHGTLWEERFKSVILGCDGPLLAGVAAYIDLNPVRAGLVSDPRDYRWSSYTEAMAGGRAALEGYQTIMRLAGGKEGTLGEALAGYRVKLYGRGEQRGVDAPGEVPMVRRGVDPKRVKEVLDGKGRLSWDEVVMCRVRYFADGAAIGSREFVEELFRANRQWFGGKRREGAVEMSELEGGEWFTLRGLRAKGIG